MSQDEDVFALEEECLALVRRARLSARELTRAVHPKLDPSAYSLLVLLARNPALRMSEIAEALTLDKSTVSRQVDVVVRLGLVERVPDPRDSRARLVVLTDVGQERLTEQVERQRRRWREALRAWSSEDVTELTRLLRRLMETGVV